MKKTAFQCARPESGGGVFQHSYNIKKLGGNQVVETFLELVMATSHVGTVTEFYACADLITIDGVEKSGKPFHLTYRTDGGESDADS